MYSKFNGKDILTILGLLIAVFVTVATSQLRMSLIAGTFYIISDCGNSTLEATVDVSNYQIVNPSTMSFLDFGFPVAQLTPDADMIGAIGSTTRTCKKTFGGDHKDKDMIFTCYDNNQYACSILIQEP